MRANKKTYHIFKPNRFRDVQNLHQDKASMDKKLDELKLLTSTWWNGKKQPLTIDMTNAKYNVWYRLVTNYSFFVQDSSPF